MSTQQQSEHITVTSPYSGQAIGSIPAMPASEIEAAIARAHAFQPRWGATPLYERLHMLRRARGVLLRRLDELARLIAAEQGKPVLEAMLAELMTGLASLGFYVHEAPRLLGDHARPHRVPFLADKKARVLIRPRGVTSILAPWNYSFGIPFGQMAANIAVGNTVVMRPSTSTPLIALAMEAIFREAGVPREALQVVTCRTADAGALVEDPRVRLVVFTGSTAVGREVMAKASRNLCKTVLELGGKDPMVIFDDAPLERAARGAVWAAFMNAGQTCASTERVYVQRDLYPRFVQRVTELTRQLLVGDPLDPDTEVGPMTTEDGVRKVAAQVDEARARGARVLTGGERGEGRFYPPTVLIDVNHDMQVMREETFGPLLPIMPFDTEDEAVRLANDCEYALTASVFTADRTRARRMAERLDAGAVTINDAGYSFAESGAPWGGPKNSGIGRTHGPEGLMELVEVKYVSEDWSMRDKQLWWYPYDAARFAFFKLAFEGMYAPSITARVMGLTMLLPYFPLLAAEASLPAILSRMPQMLTE